MFNTTFISLAILGAAGAQAQQGTFPWKAGASPPLVGGIRLGLSRAALDSILGRPDKVQQMGQDGLGLTYTQRGISIVYTPLDGAAIVYLLRRDAGDIGGVRLGDTKDQVLARWGKPSTGEGMNALYIAGKWVVVITLDSTGTRVVQLGLGRAADAE